ncbi:MAG: prepilin-type N-terminal cleavage/methylation domain-containing protein [Clostridia bacterium]
MRKLRKIFKSKKGFTLVELLVSITIFSIVMMAASGILTGGMRFYDNAEKQLFLESKGAIIMKAFVEELRKSKAIDLQWVIPDNYTYVKNNKDDAVNGFAQLPFNNNTAPKALASYYYLKNSRTGFDGGYIYKTDKANREGVNLFDGLYDDYKITDLYFKLIGERKNVLQISFVLTDGKYSSLKEESFVLPNFNLRNDIYYYSYNEIQNSSILDKEVTKHKFAALGMYDGISAINLGKKL